MRKVLFWMAGATLVGCGDDVTLVDPTPRGDPLLQSFETCQSLETRLKRNASAQVSVPYGFGRSFAAPEDGFEADASVANEATSGSAGGRTFSETNTQERGVDEADLVKTDGDYVYLVNGNRFHVFGVPTPGALEHASQTTIEGYPREFLLHNATSRAIVFSDVYEQREFQVKVTPLDIEEPAVDGIYYGGTSLTKITVLKLSDDRQTVSVEHEWYLEQQFRSARLVADRLVVFGYNYRSLPIDIAYPELPDTFYVAESAQADSIYQSAADRAQRQNLDALNDVALSAFVPKLYVKVDGALVTRDSLADDCSNVAIARDNDAISFAAITSLALGDTVALEIDYLVANDAIAYASESLVVMAEPSNPSWWYTADEDATPPEEATNLHVYSFAEGATSYISSNRIVGSIQSSFNLSAIASMTDGIYSHYLRLAFHKGNNWWIDRREIENGVAVFGVGEGLVDALGSISGIAENENLWATRFTRDAAYLVTFRNIDPLWTIDLTDPDNPTVLGELEIPGVSTYIHVLEDQERLLTIGYPGDQEGLFWDQTRISTFDVSTPETPTSVDTYDIAPEAGFGWSYSQSEAQYEHRAFQYWAAHDLLAIPVSTYRYSGSTYEYASRVDLIRVDPATGALSSYGAIDHSSFYPQGSDWYASRDVRRALFIDDYVYSVSDRALTAHHMGTLQQSAAESLPGTAAADFFGEPLAFPTR